MGNSWLVLPGKHSSFNDTSDEKNFIFTACGITIKKGDRALWVEQDQVSLDWVKLSVTMLWVPAVRSSQNQNDDSSGALLPSAPRGTRDTLQLSEPCAGGKSCPTLGAQLWHSCALCSLRWPTYRRAKPLCLVQCSHCLRCFKLSFPT